MQSGDTIRSYADHGMLGFSGSDIEFIKQKAGTLINDLTATLENLNKLVEGNTESITQIFSNLAGVTGSLNAAMSSEQGSLKGIIGDINDLSTTLRNNTGRIDNILENVEGFTDSLRSTNLPELIDNLSITLIQFNALIDDVNEGEGSIGKLLKDEDLYDSLVEASSNLARLLEDVKENPARYVNISVFGGKKK
ncbi:MAG: hypothetical protein LUE10_00975 [Alistipes sp.]|nr:hypothetical protein [Alistipes sp.]